MSSTIEVYADAAELAAAARQNFVTLAAAAIAERGRCDVALAGGSTPRAFYTLLESSDLDWRAVHFFFGDERCVPETDERSNFAMAKAALFDRLAIDPSQVHRLRGELEPTRAADEYQALLAQHFGSEQPRFDLCWLGLGSDGHTASLFPGTRALEEQERSCVANWVSQWKEWRLTLTLPAITASKQVLFVVSGSEKRAALQHVLAPCAPELQLPAARVSSSGAAVTWLIDRAAEW